MKVTTVGSLVAYLAVGIFGAASCNADDIGYGFDTQDRLFSVNFTKASATLITEVPNFFEAIAVSNSGQLFGINISGLLMSIDTTTGALTVIGDTHLGPEGMSFNGDTLIATDNLVNASFYSIDTTTAKATYISTTDPGYGMCRALTFHDPNVAFFASDRPSATTFLYQSLIKSDLTTGASTVMGLLEVPSHLYAMSFAPNGNLYGLSADGGMYSINSSNGKVKLLGNTGGQVWVDMTISSVATAVPEPGAYGMLAGILVPGGAFLIRRRKRMSSQAART